MDLKKLIREMSGKNRCDLTQLFAGPRALQYLITTLAEPFRDAKINKVVALEAIGFVLGAGVALELKAGLVLIRKQDKIAWTTRSVEFTDYTHKTKRFEIADDAILPGDKILIVDDWTETGAQLKAAISLVEQMGGIVSGISCLNVDPQAKSDKTLSNYRLYSVIEY